MGVIIDVSGISSNTFLPVTISKYCAFIWMYILGEKIRFQKRRNSLSCYFGGCAKLLQYISLIGSAIVAAAPVDVVDVVLG